MPRRGFLSLRYYCGDGERIRGCRAEVTARKALLSLVKIDEADLLADENNTLEDGTKIHNLLLGVNYAKQYKPSAGSRLSMSAPSHSTPLQQSGTNIWRRLTRPQLELLVERNSRKYLVTTTTLFRRSSSSMMLSHSKRVAH